MSYQGAQSYGVNILDSETWVSERFFEYYNMVEIPSRETLT